MQLADKYPDWKFQILGEIDNETPSALNAKDFRLLVSSSNSIQYLGTSEDVRNQIAEADAIVLPSYREGTPRVLLEALSMARPVVASRVPGCVEVVRENENGYFAEVKDPVSLS